MAKDTVLTPDTGGVQKRTTSDNLEDCTNAADALAVNDVVYLSGNSIAAKADATDETKPAIGIVFELTDSTNCRVLTRGVIEGFGTGMAQGQAYYLSLASGALTTTPVSTAGNFHQYVGFAFNSTDLFVDPSLGAVLVATSTSPGVRFNPATGLYEIVASAMSGDTLPVRSYVGSPSLGSNIPVVGLPLNPHREAGGRAFSLQRLTTRFVTSSPSSCTMDMRAYIHRAVGGTYVDDEVLKVAWTSADIASDAAFVLNTRTDQSGRGLTIAARGAEASKVLNPKDGANETTATIQAAATFLYQKFTVPATDAYLLTKIKVYVGYGGSLVNATLRAHIADLNSNGTGTKPKPKTTNTYRSLSEGSEPVAASAMVAGGGWVTFTFSDPVFLRSNHGFALVLEATANGDTISATNQFVVYATTDSAYSGGGQGNSTDSGASWGAASSTNDLVFEVLGQTAEGIFVNMLAATSNVKQITALLDGVYT